MDILHITFILECKSDPRHCKCKEVKVTAEENRIIPEIYGLRSESVLTVVSRFSLNILLSYVEAKTHLGVVSERSHRDVSSDQ